MTDEQKSLPLEPLKEEPKKPFAELSEEEEKKPSVEERLDKLEQRMREVRSLAHSLAGHPHPQD